MIPFLRWLENESPALSPPQHKSGEQGKKLDEVVGKRLMELAMDMETRGQASRQDVLKSIQRIIGTTISSQTQEQPTQEQPAQDPTQPQMQIQNQK